MHRYVAKTVRDDEHGYLFTFVEHPEKGITQIAYYIQITPAFRERNVLLFHTHAFRNAVHALRAGGYDREAMRRALTYCFYSAEMRACPKCNARVITECKCKLVIQRKTHHLDHAGEWRNLASYGGEYEGMASLGIYENGRNVFRANYVARVSGALTMDGDCQRGLSKWAMCDAARKRRVNVLKLCMPDLNEVQVAKLLPASEHPNPPKHMPHLIEDASKPKQHQDTYSVGSNYSAAPSTDDGLPRAGSPHREMLEAGEASDREPTVVDVSNMQDKSAVRGAALKPLQPTPVLVDPQIQKRKLVSLAPAPSASAIDGDEFMDERQQRLEARKARNRESALRSNHRKKIALQELKDNIKEVLEREVHLRKREAELREENAMLKSSLMR